MSSDKESKSRRKPAARQAPADHHSIIEALLNSSGSGIYIVQDRKFIYASPYFSQLSGYSLQELEGKDPLGLVHPDDREMVKENASAALKHGWTVHPYEFRFLKKNGDNMWVIERVSAIEYGGRRATLGSFMDIGRSKELEQELALSEKQHRAILDQMNDACFELGLDGNFTFVNNFLCRTVQYKRDELVGHSYRVIIPESDAQSAYPVFNRVFKTGIPNMAYIHRVRRKDGLEFYVESSISLTRDAGGRPSGFICVGRDISERRRLERALLRSEERFRDIVEGMQDSYYEVDLAGNFTFVNGATARHLLFTREELLGNSFHMIMQEDEAQKVFDAFHRVFTSGEPNPGFAHMVTRKDGTTGYADSAVSLLRDDNGLPIGFSSVSRDVTERKRLEELLRESEERYRGILEEMHDSYFEVDLAGNFVYVNQSVCSNMLYCAEELLGSSYAAHVPEEDVRALFKAFNEVFRTGIPKNTFEHRLIRKDGQTLHASTSIALRRDISGKPVGFRSVARDVSERKKLEAALLEEKNFSDSVIDSLPGIFYTLDEYGRFVRWNKYEEKVLGYDAGELQGMDALNTISAPDRQRVADVLLGVLGGGDTDSVEAGALTKDGREIPFLLTGNVTEIGNKTYLVGMGIDISERKKLEEALRRSEERFRNVLENMQDSYFEVDLKGNFMFINLSASNRMGYSREELLGRNFRMTTPDDDVANQFAAFNEVFKTGLPNSGFLHKHLCKDGSIISVESSIGLLHDEKGNIVGFNSVSRDVTQRLEFEQRLADMATHDFLTGLPNRVLLHDRLHVALAQAQRNKNKLAILTLDLDKFKAVNDTHGHHVGDELLKAIGQRLTGVIRSGDTIARMGGDEFMLLMPELHQSDDVEKIIGKLLKSFDTSFIIQGHRLNMSCSIGIAIYPDDGADMDALMKKSDSAMYSIKKHGPSPMR